MTSRGVPRSIQPGPRHCQRQCATISGYIHHQCSLCTGKYSKSNSSGSSGRTRLPVHCQSAPFESVAGLVGEYGDVIRLLIFSAAPFVLVQSFADSKVGKEIFERLERERPGLEREAALMEQERVQVRTCVLQPAFYGPNRPLWLRNNSYTPPSWLEGVTYPGDYGFDPLGLGKDDMERYFELELLHGRWAMLGALGAVVPELLNECTSLNIPEPRWWNVGAYKAQSGEDLNYFGIEGLRIAGNQGILVILVCQILLMFGPEYARSCGRRALEPLGIFLPGSNIYPGGWLFDPFSLAKSPEVFELMKVRETKHGRLAMTAWVILALQAYWTRDGILDWIFHYTRCSPHT